MLNLFALTDDPTNRRVRFSLAQDVQTDLATLFTKQAADFSDHGQEEIQFDGKYKPDLGEILVINGFDDIDRLADAVANPLSVPEVQPTPDTFDAIKALFSGQIDASGVVTVLVQHFDKKRVISTNGLSIFHSSNVYKKIEGIGLTIDSKITATIKNGTLKFHSFHLVRQVFDMSAYYKEATDSDINDFATLPCLAIGNVATLVANSDNWVRRKLWLISQSQILIKVPICDIKAIAAEFSVPIETEHSDGVEKIKIPEAKRDLKTLLRFLDEDYYKSPLLQNRYITNSKRLV